MVKQKFFIHFSATMINMLFHTVSGIIVARIAGPTILGIINYGTSYVAMFGIILSLFSSSHTKMVSQGCNLGDCVKTYGTLQSVLIIFYGIFFFVSSYVKTSGSGEGFLVNTQDVVVMILFIANFIHYFINIITGTFGARAEMAKQSIPFLVEGVVGSVLRVLVVVLGFGAVAIASTSLFTTLLIIPIVMVLYRGYPKGKFDVRLAKTYFQTSVWFFVIQASALILQNYGKVFLEHHSSVTEVGIFSGGYSLAGILLLVASTSGTVFFPLFSRMVAEGKLEQISSQIYKYQRFLLIFVLPFVVIVAIYAKHIITTILGPTYLNSIPVLSILIVSSFITIYTLPYGNLIIGAGRLITATIISASQVIIFTLLLFVFVSEKNLNLGSKGLALAILLSFIYCGISYYIYARKIVDFHNTFKLLKLVVLSTFMYMLLRYVDYLFHPNVLVSIGISLASLVIYYSVSYLFKWVVRSDWDSVLQMLKPSSSMTYIKAEMQDSVD